MIGRYAVWLVAVLSAGAACARRDAPAPAGTPIPLVIGTHRLQIAGPAGWLVLDQGAQKRFRKGDAELLLRDLGPVPLPAGLSTRPPLDLAAQADWGLAALGHDQRRDVKSRRTMTVSGRDAVEIETWNRLAHTNVQRYLFVADEGGLLALSTPREADPESVTAFELIRDSIHFAAPAADVRR